MQAGDQSPERMARHGARAIAAEPSCKCSRRLLEKRVGSVGRGEEMQTMEEECHDVEDKCDVWTAQFRVRMIYPHEPYCFGNVQHKTVERERTCVEYKYNTAPPLTLVLGLCG